MWHTTFVLSGANPLILLVKTFKISCKGTAGNCTNSTCKISHSMAQQSVLLLRLLAEVPQWF